MKAIITFENGMKKVWYIVQVEDLSNELKQTLVNKFSLFVKCIDDCETEDSSSLRIRSVKFLDDCYRAA